MAANQARTRCGRLLHALALIAVWGASLHAPPVQAKSFVVRPFLQAATPTSIGVVWQTSLGRESIVEWGPTPKLGFRSRGLSHPMPWLSRRHEVTLRPLRPDTRYYYRVRTGRLVSQVAALRTPPRTRDEKSFRLLVMSDMQHDGRAPSKFHEVVERGILLFAAREYGVPLEDAFALALVPGDLVRKGTDGGRKVGGFGRPS